MTIMRWAFIALACLVFPQVWARTTDDNNLKTQKYQWKTGSWGTCYVAGGCGEGRRERQVRCSDPEGRTVLELMCDPITAPLKIKLCFTACRHHRDKLQWQVGAWGPCLPVSPAGLAAETTDIKERENLGVTQRNVTCVLVSHDAVKVHRIVDDDNCFTVARKPDPVRFCHIPKPQDCVVSQFSSWSLCDGCGDDVNNQTRVRVVIVAPMNGGKPCPELTEMRPCNPRMECLKKTSENISDIPRYKLKVGEWRRCEAPTSMVSADTIESRVISHLGREGGHGLYPPSIMYPASSGTSAEVIENYYTFQPQVGYQTREVSCRDPKGTIVDISLCLGEEHNNQHLPTRVRPCVVSQDCVVSQWSAWTRTQDGCVAVNGKVRAEIHQRKREVVRLQEGEGQLCPHLLELRQTTDKDQLQLCSNKYRWLASKWSPCVVTSDESSGPRLVEVGCGGGVQLRDVTCIATQSGKPVSHELCDSLEILPTVQRCEVACPRDCEVGTWGVWGPCKPIECPEYGDTLPQGYRERRRTIEVMSSEQGVDCPSIKEVQPCPQPTCYNWVEGQWTPCYLDPDVKRCGEGRKTRTVSCRSTLYGNIVDDSLCTRRQVKPPTEEPCLLPCPFDCVLSPWSEWSPCSHSCSSLRQAALRQRNRTVIAPPGSGGHGCPDPDEMLQIEPCNTHSCHGYSWFTLPWQPCQVFHSATNITTNSTSLPQFPPELELDMLGGDPEDVADTKEDEEEDEDAVYNSTVATCGDGEQEREVWCLEANDKRVPDWKCQPLPKPTTTRSCTRVCPVNCRMSPWSEWSTCPQQCVPDSSAEVRDGEVTPTQSRRRVVIQWPANGGLPCQNLEELRPCPLSGARCKHYLWGIGPWSDCQLPANVECGMGYRTRAVWCYRNHRSVKVEPSLCLKNNGSFPEQSEPCTMDCQWPCVLSHWSGWSECKHACTSSIRTRQLIGLSSSRAPCMNPQVFPLVQREPCPCDLYISRPIGDWSDCVLDRDIVTVSANGRPAQGVCGSGSRYRRIGCYNKDNDLVEPSLCDRDDGLEEEPCLMPCPTDCLLSEWTSWGDCSTICGPGVHNRTRKVLQPSMNAGRPCEDMVQYKVCNKPCDTFQWFTGGWSECQLIGADQERGCGTGDQYRQVRCMQLQPHELPTEVSDMFCDPIVQPADVNACHVACPGDCVLGRWSDWSECYKPCESDRERQRTRSILRAPQSNAATCPQLIEVQPCQLNVTCFTYSWRWTDYSSCLPLGGSPCGEGVQSRAVYCLRSDGRPVADSLCEDQSRPAPTEKWCYVDCPVDCEVTRWTLWNTSECLCGNTASTMMRYRYIVTNPSEKGRPCPLPLIQHKPCPAVPCYTWDRGDWDTCSLHATWCGHGTIHRNITCLRGSLPVESRLCVPTTLDLKTEDSCYVPCRGDCQVSEWSHWSHCHRNCQGTDVGGYQTRSRAVLKPPNIGGEPCPTALWETRPCFTGPCLTFDWAVDDDGQLTCRRSDGVVVIGGCESKPRPCPVQCGSIQHAVCDPQSGVCQCELGYQQSDRGPCVLMAEVTMTNEPPLRHRHITETVAASEDEIQSRFYYPKDDDINVWMFAMIGIGCVFIVFVAVSLYLMCHSSAAGHPGQQEQTLTVQQAVKP